MAPTRNHDAAAAQCRPPHETMARIIGAHTPATGDYETSIAGLFLFRRDAPAPPAVCMIEPSIVLVAQGAKQMWVGGEGYPYDTSRFLVTSLDMPANSEVRVASAEQPCLGLLLRLDVRVLAELLAHGSLPPHRERPAAAGQGSAAQSASASASQHRRCWRRSNACSRCSTSPKPFRFSRRCCIARSTTGC